MDCSEPTANYFTADFSPHDALAHQTFFGWILPTLRISEFAVLQIVGLDAAVVSFLRLAGLSILAHWPLSAAELPQNVVLFLLDMCWPRRHHSNAHQLPCQWPD